MSVRAGVVVTTYRRPDALELVLRGYACQDTPAAEILVADDGSGDETGEVVDRVAEETGLPLVHVWHEDRGFRKTEVLNRAIRAAAAEYLIFTDGDCVPRRDFVATHLGLARPGHFLSGGYVRLSRETTEALTSGDVESGRAFEPGWLAAHGTPGLRNRLRLLRGRTLPGLLDRVTPTRATWNGMGSSTWRQDLLRVNGFDLDLVYGGLDRELGQRLENAGLKGVQIRHRAVVLHLWHERPYRDEETMRRQRRHRGAIRVAGTVRAARGIQELDDGVNHRVRRHPGEAAEQTGTEDI
ncbi:MAG: glycosyltransferase family 2 protein [Gemmatimonadales bacterium]|nr:MAG: glycosyltransferase family 2 protein [Gemmatimonadales bacterium]